MQLSVTSVKHHRTTIKGLTVKGLICPLYTLDFKYYQTGDVMFASSFGELLRGARKHRGLTRAALAERGGVSVRLVAEL